MAIIAGQRGKAQSYGGGARVQPGDFLYNFVETGHIIRRWAGRRASEEYQLLHLWQRQEDHRPNVQQRRREQSRTPRHKYHEQPHLGRQNGIAVVQGSRGGANAKGKGSLACIQKIVREEGFKGIYRGLTASYLGVTDGTIQWVLYERLKKLTANAEGQGGWKEWAGMLGSAGTAKCVATLITYPHESYVRALNRLFGHGCDKLPPTDGSPKYTGLWRTLRVLIAEEGARSLYGGLSVHLMRVIPNSAVMYAIYEAALRINF
ncbi:mitochondrial carrier domain-containing protein [Ephemerocybe angulata]|uniref:Mitochondrial carrier domain-containing protein n=1 Tax=Ephemerocybe angulata TaxID=980116 RepID=A0A8H6MA76_9AGAR|nr:mitochondrial carrier domain-containing protein [Tulosesus angulatus]